MGRRARLGAVVLWGALVCFGTGCGDSADSDGGDDPTGGSPLTAKFINSGTLAITGLYHQPVGVLPMDGWQTADLGDNILPLDRIEQNEYVMFVDFPRQDLDMVAAFDSVGTPTMVRWNVPAQWIGNAEYLSINAGRNADGGGGQGHQFGLVEYTTEVDVTP